MNVQKQTTAQFSEIKGTGISIAKVDANHKESMAIPKQNGLRALKYQEALVLIDKNPELKEQLKGEWFWLDGEGIELSGFYKFNGNGEFTKGRGGAENTVYVSKGNHPLLLVVRTDDSAYVGGRRFILEADGDSQVAAPVVVGIKDGREAATLENAHSGETAVITGITRKEFKELQRCAAEELDTLIKQDDMQVHKGGVSNLKALINLKCKE